VMERMYHEENPIGMPKMVLVPALPEQVEVYEEWLSMQRGSTVEVRVPQRGEKRTLHETATRNAKESFNRHRLKRGADHNSRAKALNELQQYLKLPKPPLRIECYDMSHLQGTDYVGSMVVVEDGLPRKSEYRRFKIKTVEGNDDFAAMEEVLTRRLTAYITDKDLPAAEQGKFAYPPQLILVDGGKGQLSSTMKVIDALGLRDEIPVASLAKQFEEVFLPEQSESIKLPRQSDALYMLQRIRDESHRFAITYHRQLRAKRMTKSVIDDIPGLGEARKKRLVKELGGVKAIKNADLPELQALSWLPDAVALAVYEKVRGFKPRT
jgi:excinuclease ABC subunit C